VPGKKQPEYSKAVLNIVVDQALRSSGFAGGTFLSIPFMAQAVVAYTGSSAPAGIDLATRLRGTSTRRDSH
jgi:hypothetical protein